MNNSPEILGALVDKIAKKMSIAIDAATPIAKEFILEIRLAGAVEVLAGLAMLVAAIVLYKLGRKMETDLRKSKPKSIGSFDDMEDATIFGIALAGILCISSTFWGATLIIAGLKQVIAPLPYLAGM